MSHYNKGAAAERELMKILEADGFSMARVAGSGSNPLPCPDMIAMKKTKKYAIECKSWKGTHLVLSKEQMDEIAKWSENAGIDFLIAWRMPGKKWFFLNQKDFNKTDKNFLISAKKAKEIGLTLNSILNGGVF